MQNAMVGVMTTRAQWDGVYHQACRPICWNHYDAFNKFGFDDGNSHRNYTYIITKAIEALGYQVEHSGWGGHNRDLIKRLPALSTVWWSMVDHVNQVVWMRLAQSTTG